MSNDGEKGYAYCQTDPLFTIDLSDPLNPEVIGELHIPGFSTIFTLWMAITTQVRID